jgi:hypothetical protein
LLQGDRTFGLFAGEVALELLSEAAPGPKQQRLDRAGRQLERVRDLARRPTLELAHHQRRALIERQLLERAHEIVERRSLLVGYDVGDFVPQGYLERTPGGLAEALTAEVQRNAVQPRPGASRSRSALDRAVRVEKRGLGDVFCVGCIPEQGGRVLVDVADVALI